MKRRLFILSVLTVGLALLLTRVMVIQESEIVLEPSPNLAFASRPFIHTVQNSISLDYTSEMTVTQIWSSESNDSHTDWYTRPLTIEYPFSPRPDITMTPIDEDAATPTIYVDPSRTSQIFLGFGESFEGSTIYNLSRMSQQKRAEVLEKLIDPDTGAGFNLFRICIGTSDFSPEAWGWYSLHDDPQDDFSIQKDIDNGIISVLQEALQIANNKGVNLRFIASPWSPPGWMKTTGSMIGGELLPQYNDDYAEYLYKFLDEYRKVGIPIYAITVQNEPGWVTTTPSTCMLPTQEVAIIKKLKEYIDDDQNIDTKILAHDWNFDDTQRQPHDCLTEEYNHIQLAKDVLTFLNSPSNYTEGVAFHSYDWEDHDEDNIIELYRLYPDLKMFHTERAEWRTDGMDRIVRMFRHQISTYVGWVTMLDNDITDGGDEDEQFPGTPTPPSFIYDVLELIDDLDYWPTPTYYLKQQFSKFIQLGAVRIYSNVGASQLSNVAFLNPDNTVVLIVVNQNTDPQEFRVITSSKQFTTTIPGKLVASYKWRAGNIPRNLAAGKTVVVSSTENDTNIGANAVDGDSDTRWASQWNDDQWIYVDLGCRYNIDRVVLDWEDAFGKEYDIQISDDPSTWTTVYHEDNGFIGINIHNIEGTGRYIRMKGITRGTGWGYSLYDFAVYGTGSCVYLPIIIRQ